MPNCRSIPPKVWAHVHEALVFYFSRRHGIENAQDLAQDTIAAVLSREDFEFEKEEDFLRVCYGFASRISQSGYRSKRKLAAGVPGGDSRDAACRKVLLHPPETAILLDEVLRTGQSRLSERDWNLIQQAASDEGNSLAPGDSAEGNNLRVRLHRARRKLAKLTGWKK